MPNEYTPTTKEIRAAWAAWWEPREDREPPTWHPDEFDRWIAQVKADAAAQALEDAADEVSALDFGASWASSAHRWGAKQAAHRLRARAVAYRKEQTNGTD